MNILRRIHEFSVRTDDYFEHRKTNNKKKKWVTRVDFVFFALLIIFCIVVLLTSHNTTSTNKSHVVVAPGGGQGGGADLLCNSPDNNPNHCTTLPSSDPQLIIDQWDTTGQKITDQTYQAGKGGDFLTDLNHGAFFYTNPDNTVNNGDVRTMWSGLTALVASILTLAFVLIGIRVMSMGGIRYAEAVESVPRAVLAAVAAIMSLVFVAVVITFSNGLSQLIVGIATGKVANFATGNAISQGNTLDSQLLGSIIMPISAWQGTFNSFTQMLSSMFFGNAGGQIPIIGFVFQWWGTFDAGGNGYLNLASYVQLFLSVMLGLQVILRLATIDLYIVMSPLAFICGAIPSKQAQNMTQMWISGFLSAVFVQVLQILCLCVGVVVFQQVLGADFGVNVSLRVAAMGPGTGVQVPLLLNLTPIAILWFVLRVPRLINSSAVQTITSAGQTVSGAVRAATSFAGF